MAVVPRVTVGVMTFNNERYLPGAFDAVLTQDFTDFEVVVCDNQSTDGTWEICQRYAEKDGRFRIHRNEKNLGFSGNFNRVVELARGEYFRLTSHDDLIAPTLLGKCVAALDADPAAVLAYPYSIIIDGAGREICQWDDVGELRDPRPYRRLATLVRKWMLINELFGVVRTDVLRRTRLFRPYSSTDMRLVAELAVRGQFHVVPEPLFYRRIHESGSFGADRPAGSGEHLKWLEPDVAAREGRSVRHDRVHGDHGHMTMDTIGALIACELPLSARLANTATFTTVFLARRARIFLGRWRRRLTGAPMARAKWDVGHADGNG